MDKSVTQSNLAKTNEKHDYTFLEEFTYHLVAEAVSKVPKRHSVLIAMYMLLTSSQ